MRSVWLVIGSSGEYDDYRQWIVAGFLSRDAAEAHAARARDWSRRAREAISKIDERVAPNGGWSFVESAVNPWDSRDDGGDDSVTFDVEEVCLYGEATQFRPDAPVKLRVYRNEPDHQGRIRRLTIGAELVTKEGADRG